MLRKLITFVSCIVYCCNLTFLILVMFLFFQAFASLGANDEDIRKKIIETDNLMEHIVSGLQDHSPKVRLSAIRCLHSLSRSVQQLRTTFQVCCFSRCDR